MGIGNLGVKVVTEYLDRPGGKIAYDDRGSGPLIVCVPSMGDVRAEYRFLAPALVAAGFRVVTLDVRGHGESSATFDDVSVGAIGSDIVALLRHLDAGPAVIVGTSMAAGASVWAAAEAPDVITGLVLVGPFVRDVGSLWQTRLMFGALFAGPWSHAVWKNYYPTLYPSVKPADFEPYLAAVLASLREPGRMASLRRMLLASKRASEERLSRVRKPVLVVMGSRDRDFKDPAAEANLVAQRLNGRVQMIDGAGHYPHAEMPDRVAPLIIDFAQSVLRTGIPKERLSNVA